MKKRLFLFLSMLILIALMTACQTGSSPKTNSAGTFEVNYLDVGQADSIVIQTGTSAMLIDAGSNSTANSLVSTLKNLGINKFDVVVGTHPHEDHIGGMDAVVNQFEIGKILMPKITATTQTYIDVLTAIRNKGLSITTPVPGTSFNLGSAQYTILAPNSPEYSDVNNYSIVIRMVYGNTSFLFTGDAQSASEQEILAKGYTLKSDVLKVGHHGSSTSTSATFLKAVSPSYAIISVGQGNDYGHPHRETLDKLNAAGIKILRTDLNGTVTFDSDGLNLTVKKQR